MVFRLCSLALVVAGLLTGCAETTVTPISTRNLFDDAEGKATSIVDTKLEQYHGLARDYPRESKYQERLSRLYMEKSDHKKALKYIRRAQKLDPENPKYHYLEGQIFLTIGSFDNAERAYLEMIERVPDGKFSGPYFELATLYLAEDRPVEAKRVLHKCLEVDKEFPLPHYHLAEIEAAMGKREQAVHHYEEYLRLDGLRHREVVIRKLYNLQPDLDRTRRPRYGRNELPGPPADTSKGPEPAPAGPVPANPVPARADG